VILHAKKQGGMKMTLPPMAKANSQVGMQAQCWEVGVQPGW
jgi:hypothetical protein